MDLDDEESKTPAATVFDGISSRIPRSEEAYLLLNSYARIYTLVGF